MSIANSEPALINKKLLIVALALGLLAFALNFLSIALRGSTIKAYKAKDTVKVGTPLDDNLFKEVTLTGDVKEMKSIIIDSESFAALKGQPLSETLPPGALLLTRSFRLTGEGGIRDRISSNEKAVSVRVVDESQAVGYFVQPGDMVDVWGVVNGDGFLTLKNACVQAVGDAYLIPNDKGEGRYRSITVFVPNDETGIKNLLTNLSLSGDQIFLTLTGKCIPQQHAEIQAKYLKAPGLTFDHSQKELDRLTQDSGASREP